MRLPPVQPAGRCGCTAESARMQQPYEALKAGAVELVRHGEATGRRGGVERADADASRCARSVVALRASACVPTGRRRARASCASSAGRRAAHPSRRRDCPATPGSVTASQRPRRVATTPSARFEPKRVIAPTRATTGPNGRCAQGHDAPALTCAITCAGSGAGAGAVAVAAAASRARRALPTRHGSACPLGHGVPRTRGPAVSKMGRPAY